MTKFIAVTNDNNSYVNVKHIRYMSIVLGDDGIRRLSIIYFDGNVGCIVEGEKPKQHVSLDHVLNQLIKT